MSDIIVDMLPANEGDCFLITIEEAGITILIDGGTAETYYSALKSKLQKLSHSGKCIDLLIVTHIDDDHIGGILELLKENGSSQESKIVKIKNIWHNSYRHLQFKREKETGKEEKQILSNYIVSGSSQENLSKASDCKDISAKQGSSLAALILKGGYKWNQQFEGKAVCCDGENTISIGKECQITVLTPDAEALNRLAKIWKKELKSKRFAFEFSDDELFDDAYEFYMRFFENSVECVDKQISDSTQELDIEKLVNQEGNPDASKTNRASISILLQSQGKNLLFLADADADDALKKLDGRKQFDLIKLPHHGSSRNISKKFIDDMETGTYLISTNSHRYDHPDLETLAKIICKKTIYNKKIYFNYRLEKVKPILEQVKEEDNTNFVFLIENQNIVLSGLLEDGGENRSDD